jgi:hypothetical protein
VTVPEPGPPDTGRRTGAERLLAQLGGVSGVVYSSLPVVAFVMASNVSGLLPAIGSALGVSALVLLWRLIRRESMQPVLSGFGGVVFCALIAWIVGESKGYFLLGIWMSLLWAGVFSVSVLVRRPLVGYLSSWVGGHHPGWRAVPRAVYAFDIASLCWVLVFGARFVVQRHLYDADQTGWLGVARIGMGWPLTAMAALVTYAAFKSAQRAVSDATDDEVPAAGSGTVADGGQLEADTVRD